MRAICAGIGLLLACVALSTGPASAAIIGGPVPYDGHEYLLLESSDWSSAEAEAIALGGHLVTIDYALEQEFVVRAFANFDDVPRALWIGLNDTAAEGTFTWADGTPLGFTNWNPGQPNNFGNEDHVLIVPSGLTDPLLEPGMWNDWTDTSSIETILIHGVVEMPAAPIHEIRGKKLQMKDPLPDIAPAYRSVQVEGETNGGGHNIVGDPVVDGATLQLVANGATPSVQTFFLAPGPQIDGAAGWKAIGSTPVIGYQYRDNKGTAGPIQQILLKRTTSGKFQIKVKLKGQNGPGPQPRILVHPPGPGTDGGMRLSIVNGDTYCVAFGGAAGGLVSNSPSVGGPGRQFKIGGTSTKPLFAAACPTPPTTTTSITTSTSTSTTSTTSTSSTTTTSTSTTSSTSTSVTTSTSTSVTTSTSTSSTSSSSTTSTSTSTTTTTSTLHVGCLYDDTDGVTVYDTCNGLQWEKKTAGAGLRQVTNRYSWAGCCNGTCATTADLCQPNASAAAACAAGADGGTTGCNTCSVGTCVVDALAEGAVTTVWNWLAQLNASNFAGHADWRLPSEGGRNTPSTGTSELEALLRAPAPCGTNPCVESIVGPTSSGAYWSASTATAAIANAWGVSFVDGTVAQGDKRTASGRYVRAVRSATVPVNPGDLDPTFGPGGTVKTVIPGFGGGRDLVQQPDGKLVVAGNTGGTANNEFTLARYELTGALDPSFGSGGVVITPVGPLQDFANAIVLQADGRLLAAGGTSDAGNTENDFALVRYEDNGTLDGTFGTGGKVTTAFGVGAGMLDIALAATQQSNGKLVVVGTAYNAPSFSGGDTDMALARYETNGSLDPTFGTGGKLTTAFTAGSGNHDGAEAVLQLPTGELVVAGYATNAGTATFALARYATGGTLDGTFGSGGKVTTAIGTQAFGRALVRLASGKLIVAGESIVGGTTGVTLARYEANGTLDTSFGTGGSVRTTIGGQHCGATGVIEQPDGKLVIAGTSSLGANGDMILVRYDANGALDLGFGDDGIAVLPNVDSLGATGLVRQLDGKLTVSGQLFEGTGSNIFLARFQD